MGTAKLILMVWSVVFVALVVFAVERNGGHR